MIRIVCPECGRPVVEKRFGPHVRRKHAGTRTAKGVAAAQARKVLASR